MNRNLVFETPARRRFAGLATLVAMILACSDTGPAGPHGGEPQVTPRMLINGVDDFEHDAAAAIMVYDPTHPDAPGWRSFCSAALVHERVIQTAGHCIQFLQQLLGAGIVKAAWVSFQQDPRAHFNADPAVEDPASGGWYEIESLHNNPDNVNFVELRQADPEEVRAIWGKFHDSGAIVLRKRVKRIEPVRMASQRGSVERLLHASGCANQNHRGHDRACKLLAVAFGLQEFPVVTKPPVQVRHAALLRYRGIDPLFISTFDDPPGSEFGANCLGDSGAPIVLLKPNGKDRIVVAISSSPADPFGFPCTSGGLHYRTDTPSHVRFINGVIEAVRNRR